MATEKCPYCGSIKKCHDVGKDGKHYHCGNCGRIWEHTHKISTTITKKFFEMKMQDLRESGYFIEFKEDKPFWEKRILKLFPISDDGSIKPLDDIDIVFLVGNKSHRFKVASVSYHLHIHDKDSTVPERYRAAIKTDCAYGIKCVEQIARRVV